MSTKQSRKKVTIKHIAELAEVSVATVSRALKDHPSASLKTKEKILKIANELNYHPNSLAKGLRERRTGTIGIIFNDLNNPFYTETLNEISSQLHMRNYSLIICPSNYDAESEKKNILSLISRRVDGIIMSPIDENSENLKILSDNHVHTVLIDCIPHMKDKSYVYTDHLKGFELAIEYIISNGHREILFMMSKQDKSLVTHLVNVYKRTLKKHNIAFKEELIIYAEKLTIEGGYKAFKSLLTEDVQGKLLNFTSIITMNDLLALGIYKVANELSINIPGNYSIIGYDDIETASVVSPPLTTIHQSRKRIGRESVDLLLAIVEDRLRMNKRICFEPYIVARGSIRSLI
jgi:LacI family transcriptional regulator